LGIGYWEWGILLVPRKSLETQIRRLCLQFSYYKSEAEPLDIGSQEEPGNQLSDNRQQTTN
jgi:hypothetical protein